MVAEASTEYPQPESAANTESDTVAVNQAEKAPQHSAPEFSEAELRTFSTLRSYCHNEGRVDIVSMRADQLPQVSHLARRFITTAVKDRIKATPEAQRRKRPMFALPEKPVLDFITAFYQARGQGLRNFSADESANLEVFTELGQLSDHDSVAIPSRSGGATPWSVLFPEIAISEQLEKVARRMHFIYAADALQVLNAAYAKSVYDLRVGLGSVAIYDAEE